MIKLKILALLTIFVGVNSVVNKAEANQITPELDKTPPPKGIILVFKHWPLKESQKKAVLKKTSTQKFTENKQLPFLKAWIFEWKGKNTAHKQNLKTALSLCKDLSKLSYLKYCEPDHYVPPAGGGRKKKKKSSAPKPIKRTAPPQIIPHSGGLDAYVKDVSRTNTGNLKTCNIVSTKHNLKEGKLSDYWAQEMIGADLAKEDLKRLKKQPQKLLVSVWDSPINQHDAKVKNLISGKGRQAVLPDLPEQISEKDTSYGSGFLKNANDLLERCSGFHPSKLKLCKEIRLPSFINNSMYWFGARTNNKGKVMISELQSAYYGFKSLSPPSIIVTAAGNLHPIPIESVKRKAAKNFNAIIVGSIDPWGKRSRFSQEGKELTVMAPSDSLITSADRKGKYKKFGGTSGATPLVTGALAGFEWMAGYHPTAEEAKILLKKTSIRTRGDSKVGMVNAYKLAQVGKRLKSQCANDAQYPSCFKKAIRSDTTYTFPKDKGLAEALKQAFPDCRGLNEMCKEESDCKYDPAEQTASCPSKQIASCYDKAKVFKRMRQQAFLNPSDKDLWSKIGCIYQESGLYNASYGIVRYADQPLLKTNQLGKHNCLKDSDCELYQEQCGDAPYLHAATKLFILKNHIRCKAKGKSTLCNGKCQCESVEETLEPKNKGNEKKRVLNKARCINSVCKNIRSLLVKPITSSPTTVPTADDIPSGSVR